MAPPDSFEFPAGPDLPEGFSFCLKCPREWLFDYRGQILGVYLGEPLARLEVAMEIGNPRAVAINGRWFVPAAEAEGFAFSREWGAL